MLTKKNVGMLMVAFVVSCLAVGSSHGEDQTVARSTVQLSGPIGGVAGQRLVVSVASVAEFQCLPTCDLADAKFEVYPADATDLAPVVETPWTTIEAGRSFALQYDFGDPNDPWLRDEVIVRLEYVRRGRDGGRPRQNVVMTASIQVLDLADNKNQLWGDWFID